MVRMSYCIFFQLLVVFQYLHLCDFSFADVDIKPSVAVGYMARAAV